MSGSDYPMNVPRYEFLARQAMEGKSLDAYGINTSLENLVDEDAHWSADRVAIHEAVKTKLIERYIDAPSNMRAVFIGGEPGAGKSTFRNSVTGLDQGYAVSDPDVAREILIEELVARGMMPITDARIADGAQPLELSGLFHREAQEINEGFEKWCIANGKNIIFDTSLAGETKVNRDLDTLHDSGYSVTGVLIDCEPDVALQRRMARFEAESSNPEGLGGRPVPPDFTTAVRTDAPKVFEQAQLRENGFDQSVRVDVTGTEPVLIGAWVGSEIATDITGFNQMNFSPQSDALFVPDGIDGYIAPEPIPQFRDIKPDTTEVETDINPGKIEPNFTGETSFEKVQQVIPDGMEPGSSNYDIHVDYGDGIGLTNTEIGIDPDLTTPGTELISDGTEPSLTSDPKPETDAVLYTDSKPDVDINEFLELPDPIIRPTTPLELTEDGLVPDPILKDFTEQPDPTIPIEQTPEPKLTDFLTEPILNSEPAPDVFADTNIANNDAGTTVDNTVDAGFIDGNTTDAAFSNAGFTDRGFADGGGDGGVAPATTSNGGIGV